MAQSLAMKGGDGSDSYARNSTWQRYFASVVIDAIKEAVIENLDVELLLPVSGSGSGSGSTTITIADLGCSTGPNTFYAVQALIEAVEHKYDGAGDLEFQVMFNDQIGNDFNTLFSSLPEPRKYLAAGVPGSLYGRILPSSSVHIAYSSCALHWMSKVPEAVQAKESPAWNPGRIHYEGAPEAVVKAYSHQFKQDMEAFLRARAEELVGGGMAVILMFGIPRSDVKYAPSKSCSIFLSILVDMVNEGIVEQEEVDSFNIPNFFPCIEDVRSGVEENGCFEIVKLETVEVKATVNEAETVGVVMHYRAAYEKTFASHFGKATSDQFFMRIMQQSSLILDLQDSLSENGTGFVFAVLKRKLL